MDPETARIKKELGGVWVGSKGEHYEVLIESGWIWKCIRRNEWGNVSYTLRFDGRDTVIWGTAYSLYISELRQRPRLATWHSSKGKRPFVWTPAPKEAVAALAASKAAKDTSTSTTTTKTATTSTATSPSPTTTTTTAALAPAAAAATAAAAAVASAAVLAPSSSSAPQRAVGPTAARTAAAGATGAPKAAPPSKETKSEELSYAEAGAAAAAALLRRMTGSAQHPDLTTLPESATSSSSSRKAVNKITRPPSRPQKQLDFDFLKEFFSGTWVGDRFETYTIKLTDSDFDAEYWPCVRAYPRSNSPARSMTYSLYWQKEERNIVWGTNYNLSIPDFMKNRDEPQWWSSKSKRPFVWWRQEATWPPSSSAAPSQPPPDAAVAEDEEEDEPSLTTAPQPPAVDDDFFAPPGIALPDHHWSEREPELTEFTGSAAVGEEEDAAAADADAGRGGWDGYPTQHGRWRLLPPPPVHAEVAPLPECHEALWSSKGWWNQGERGTVF